MNKDIDVKFDLDGYLINVGMSIDKLADLTGIGRTTLFEIRNGKHLPSLKNYAKITTAMGIPIDNELLKVIIN